MSTSAPERTTALVSTRIDRVLWRRIRQAAIEQGRTIQVVCEEAFVSWLAHQAVQPVVLVDPKDVEELLEALPRRRLKKNAERLNAAKRRQLDAVASPDPARGKVTIETSQGQGTPDPDLGF